MQSAWGKLSSKLILFSICLLLISCSLTPEQVQQRDSYLYRAQVYYRNKKYYNSLQQIEYALEIDRECKRALIAKGWCYYYLDQNEDAERVFLDTLKLDDTDPWLQYGLGVVEYKKGVNINKKIDDIYFRIQEAGSPEAQQRIEKKYSELVAQYTAQKDKCFDKSIQYLSSSLKTNADNIELYKMLATVYATKGVNEFPTALEHADRYINLLDLEHKSLVKDRKEKEEQRANEDILQYDKETLDILIEQIKLQIENNRQEYSIMQSMAAEWNYILAVTNNQNITEKNKTKQKKLVVNYAKDAEKRLLAILEIFPEKSNNYINLARLARLQDNPELAVKYLQYYLAKYPLVDPKKRVDARLELEQIQDEMSFQHK
ncbi:MAG TPA: hypothetical protein P5543_07355 [Planctomycetota bacterium]|nr:hypothetical protein [Planctomycetota bacterium]